MNDKVSESYDEWTKYIYKVSGFVIAVCFIFEGTYIVYYKAVVKVETVQKIYKTSLWCTLTFLIAGLIHTGFIIFFVISEDFEIENSNITENELHTKVILNKTFSIVI